MSKFCDNAKVCLGLKGIQHLDDVFMLKISEDLYFLSKVSNVLFTFAMFHNKLHCSYLSCKFPPSLVHLVQQHQLQSRQVQVHQNSAGSDLHATFDVLQLALGVLTEAQASSDHAVITLPKEPSPTKSMT